jgi:hypothetical protein
MIDVLRATELAKMLTDAQRRLLELTAHLKRTSPPPLSPPSSSPASPASPSRSSSASQIQTDPSPRLTKQIRKDSC